MSELYPVIEDQVFWLRDDSYAELYKTFAHIWEHYPETKSFHVRTGNDEVIENKARIELQFTSNTIVIYPLR